MKELGRRLSPLKFKYNAAIVGMGIFGKNHLDVLTKLEEVNVVGVYDDKPERKAEIAALYPHIHFFENFESVLNHKDISVVHVATDEKSHFEIGRQVLEANKHLFMEKPITANYEEAIDLWGLSQARSKKIGVGHLLRHEKKHKRIKEKILNGDIGSIKSITLKRNFSQSMLDHYGRINAYVTAMVHDIDLIQFFTESSIERVAGIQNDPQKQSFSFNTAFLETESGVAAHIQNIWQLPESYPYGMDYEVAIYGEEGILRTSINHDIEIYQDKTTYEELFLDEALKAELEYFVDTLINEKEVSEPTIEEAIHNIEVAEELIQVANKGISALRKIKDVLVYG
jgi:UDP-N-acetylglucosamine 3-dehydrogenase